MRLELVECVFSYPGNFDKSSPACRGYSAASANRKFLFQKRRQFFIATHNETPSVHVRNPDYSPVRIKS
jgi:hypothetical protein